jgi:hypothetical protein
MSLAGATNCLVFQLSQIPQRSVSPLMDNSAIDLLSRKRKRTSLARSPVILSSYQQGGES